MLSAGLRMIWCRNSPQSTVIELSLSILKGKYHLHWFIYKFTSHSHDYYYCTVYFVSHFSYSHWMLMEIGNSNRACYCDTVLNNGTFMQFTFYFYFDNYLRGKKSYICIILFAFGCEMLTPNSLNKHMISSWSINPDQRRDDMSTQVYIYGYFTMLFSSCIMIIRSCSYPVEPTNLCLLLSSVVDYLSVLHSNHSPCSSHGHLPHLFLSSSWKYIFHFFSLSVM